MGRQDVIDALLLQLGNIQKDNGYNTDIGLNVQSMYSFEIDSETELPFVNVREGESDVAVTFGPEWQHDCPVEITICLIGTIEDIRKAVNDVFKAIKSDKTIGETCIDSSGPQTTIKKAEEGESYAEAQINITLQYLTEEWEL